MEKCMAEDARKSNERIEEGMIDLSRALNSLESILVLIETGNIKPVEAEEDKAPMRSIAAVIKDSPRFLAESAKEIRSKAERLKSMIL